MNIMISSVALDAALLVAIVIVGALLAVATFVAFFARVSIFFRYRRNNKKLCTCGLTGAEAARKLLDSKGMQDVQVKKAGFFRAWIWGNSYAPNKKTIYLRRAIIDKTSMTAVGMACQKVGLAMQHQEGDAKYKVYSKLVPYCPFVGVMFIPMVIVGLVIDMLFFNLSGIVTLIVAVIGLLMYIGAFVLIILNLPVEKKGVANALTIMQKTGIMDTLEMLEMNKLYKSYILQYTTDLIIAVLQLIKTLLQIALFFSRKAD